MDTGVRVRAFGLTLAATAALAACGSERSAPDGRSAAEEVKAEKALPAVVEEVEGATPMAERVAVLGVLNKRNGISRDLELRPGQAARFGNAVVRLRACERTQDWEAEQLTGSFVQVDVAAPRTTTLKRVFSGWLYKETPSLNVVEHPIYDVWTKECRMTRPDETPPSDNVSSADQSASTGNASASSDE